MELSERQQQILDLIRANPATTLQGIAEEIGITRERVRQHIIKLREKGMDIPVLRDARNMATKVARATERETHWQEQQAAMKLRQRRRRRSLYFRAQLARHGIVPQYTMPGANSICRFEGCVRPVQARGFCHLHYFKLRAEGVLWVERWTPAHCSQCGDPAYARGLCRRHYNSYMRKNPNKSSLPAHNTSGYRGVSWNSTGKMWFAHIREDGQDVHLGMFRNPVDAALAYDAAARRVFGEKAKLNFPNNTSSLPMREHRPANQVLAPPPDPPITKQRAQGVIWDEQRRMWRVCFRVKGEEVYSGYFLDRVLAACAYDDAVLRYHKQSHAR